MHLTRLAHAGAGSVLAACLAAGPMIAAQAPVPATARIDGAVKNAADGSPIGRARVVATAANAAPHVTLTAMDGTFTLTELPAGAYTITVTRTGYAAQAYGQRRGAAGVPIDLAPNQHVTGIAVALEAAGHIAGRILDEDGTPFTGAVVDALVTRLDGGMETLVSLASSATDDRGEFRLAGLAPGPYYLSAMDPAFRSVASAAGVQRYSPTYYPGVAAADQAKPVTVVERTETPLVEFRLRLVPPARVSGRLVAFDARPLLGAAIVMRPIQDEGVPPAVPEEPSVLPDGRFSFSQVGPGRYEIRARGQTEPAGAALFAAISVDVHGTDVEGLRMTLQPGAMLEGAVAVEGRNGTKPPRLQGLRVRAPSIDGTSFGDASNATVQPNGSFALRGVMKGSHQIAVDGLEPPWVVKDILYRGTDVSDREFAVDANEHLRDLRVTITDVSGELSGLVRNPHELPVADAAVLVFPRVPLYWIRDGRRMRAAHTDREGRFSIAGLPAGDYLAVASTWLDESDLSRRDRLRSLQHAATPLRLESDVARASLTLQLASPTALASAPIR